MSSQENQPRRDADGHRLWRDVRVKRYPVEDATAAARERDRILAAVPDERARLVAEAYLGCQNRPLAVHLEELALGLLWAGDVAGFLVAATGLGSVQRRLFLEVDVVSWLLDGADAVAAERFLHALASEVRTTDLPGLNELAFDVCRLLADDGGVAADQVIQNVPGGSDLEAVQARLGERNRALGPAAADLRAACGYQPFERVDVPRTTDLPWAELLADAEAAVRELSYERRFVRTVIFAATMQGDFARAIAIYEKYPWRTIRVADGGALVDDACLANLVAGYILGGRAAEGIEQLAPLLASVAWSEVGNAGLLGNLAEAYALADDAERSADLVERMLALGDPQLGWSYVESEPNFDGVRGTAAFARLAAARPTPR